MSFLKGNTKGSFLGKITFLFFCAVFAILITRANLVFAARVEQQKDVAVTNNFDLGPTSFSIEADPGDTVTRTLQITNREGRDQNFLVETEDFEGSADPDQTIILHGKESGRYGAKNWIANELNEFTLHHGDRQFFDVMIKVPENADVGDHYASVLVSAVPTKEESASAENSSPNVNIKSRVGTLFFIRVRGDVKEEGHLKSFSTDRPWYESGPVGLGLVYENTGSVRVQPFGKIEIKNQFTGLNAETIKVDPFNVLRDSARQMQFSWEKKRAFGRFEARLTMYRLGSENPSDVKTVSFWIIPWKQLAAIIIAIIFLIVLGIYLKRKFKLELKIQKKDPGAGKVSEDAGSNDKYKDAHIEPNFHEVESEEKK